MTVGERIRNARKNAGLTQKQLGEKCGIAEPTIRRYELGKLNPKYETLQKIATALDVPITELLGIPPARAVDPNETTEQREKRLGLKPGTFDRLLTPEGAKKLEKIDIAFRKLNEIGQDEAVKRMEELAELKQYRKNK